MVRKFNFRSVPAVVLVLSLTFGPASLSGQQSTTEIPSITIRATTRLVTVDVVVTDKKGQPITGLKPEDFTLEENGKKQKIAIFVPPGAPTGPAPAAPPSGILSNHPEHVRPAGIPTVLLLDAVNSPFKDQAYARSQMLKYVVEQGKSGQTMAVVTLTDRLRILQQFTTDPQVLMTAIKNLRPQEQIFQPGTRAPEAHNITTAPIDRGTTGSVAIAVATAQAAAQQFSDIQVGYDLERRTLITIDGMRALARILGGLPGRKNVVWLTASLPFELIPEDRSVSEEELVTALPVNGSQAVSVRAAGAAAAVQRQLHSQDIKNAESQLASSNIAIYPVDVTGLMGGMESSAAHGGSVYSDTAISDRVLAGLSAQQTSQGTMEEVAAQTGGKAFINRNEIKEGIGLATSDDKASYSLSYYPENKKWDGKFRNLKVKVSQGDTQLRYRKGFYAIDPGQAKNANYEPDVAAALDVGAPATLVSFMAQAKPTDPGKLRVVFLVDAHTLSAEDVGGKKRLNLAMYATVYDGHGRNLGTRSTKIDQAFDDATFQQILAKGMMVPIDMDMPAGATELRAAVLDNKTGFIGTANGPLGQ